MRILIVGQAPASSGAGAERAFDMGPSTVRLERLLGLAAGALLDDPDIEAVNLLSEFPGALPGGDAFDPKTAREVAARIDVSEYDLVILCGGAVRHAFGFPTAPYLDTVTNDQGVRFFILPHPSGRSRWWNVPRNRTRAAKALARLVPERGLFAGRRRG